MALMSDKSYGNDHLSNLIFDLDSTVEKWFSSACMSLQYASDNCFWKIFNAESKDTVREYEF